MSVKRARTVMRRKLRIESLCKRELLAGDMTNPDNPLDVNGSGDVTGADALGIINYLGAQQAGEGEQTATALFPDTNGDNQVTSADALGVINNLSIEAEEVSNGNGNISVPGLHVRTGRSIVIEFEGDNATLTVSSPAAGMITFSAGGQSETLAIRDSLIVRADGNGNRMTVDGAMIPKRLEVHVKGNDNALYVTNTTIGDDLIYRGGDGADGVFIDSNTQISEVLDIKTRRGNDYVTIRGVTVGQDALVNTDRGWDFVAIDGLTVEDDAHLLLGAHNDSASLLNVLVGDVAEIHGQSGHDVATADPNTVGARRILQNGLEAEGSVLSIPFMIESFFGSSSNDTTPTEES